ncbi:hypothetical protein BCD67_25095 [Oscillatoriales cyanobacterium USR001]|nr:hypothetical protein BCD67_25095 [Oscillatoriales cyanobacterium USR001]
MTTEVAQDINNEETFERDIAQLLERTRKSKWAKSELFTIVRNGLEVTRTIDDIYYDHGAFTRFHLYRLYKVAFEVWSYQHQAILQILESSKQQELINNSPRVLEHQYIAIKMFDKLNDLPTVIDPDSLRTYWLLVWRQTIVELAKFVDIPMVHPVKAKKPNLLGFNLGIRLPDMSPNTKYVILMAVLLLLGILIATLLLIGK